MLGRIGAKPDGPECIFGHAPHGEVIVAQSLAQNRVALLEAPQDPQRQDRGSARRHVGRASQDAAQRSLVVSRRHAVTKLIDVALARKSLKYSTRSDPDCASDMLETPIPTRDVSDQTETPAWVSNGTDAASAHNASLNLLHQSGRRDRRLTGPRVADRGKDERDPAMAISPATYFACSGSNRSLSRSRATTESMSGCLGERSREDVQPGRTALGGLAGGLVARLGVNRNGTDISISPSPSSSTRIPGRVRRLPATRPSSRANQPRVRRSVIARFAFERQDFGDRNAGSRLGSSSGDSSTA